MENGAEAGRMKAFVALEAQTLAKLADWWWAKLFVGGLLFAFGGDRGVHVMYMALAVLWLLDLATGYWKARKAGTATSRDALVKTGFKWINQAVVIVAARMLEIIVVGAIGVPSMGVMQHVTVKVAVVYLAVHEAISIDENLRAINGIGLGAILANLKRLTGQGGDPR